MSPSAFKQTLVRLPLGAEIGLEAPKGALQLPEETAVPLVLLAGGIGITPFRSMLTHVVRAATGHRVTLFYSNRRPEEAPVLEEVLALDGAREGVRVVATMTRMHESARHWDGPTGRLGPELVQEHCPRWREARFLLAGPPPMVEALQGLLGELGVSPERVQPERFLGY